MRPFPTATGLPSRGRLGWFSPLRREWPSPPEIFSWHRPQLEAQSQSRKLCNDGPYRFFLNLENGQRSSLEPNSYQGTFFLVYAHPRYFCALSSTLGGPPFKRAPPRSVLFSFFGSCSGWILCFTRMRPFQGSSRVHEGLHLVLPSYQRFVCT